MEKLEDILTRSGNKVASASEQERVGERAKPKLLPDRHPVRDFFIADIAEWALKDDRHSRTSRRRAGPRPKHLSPSAEARRVPSIVRLNEHPSHRALASTIAQARAGLDFTISEFQRTTASAAMRQAKSPRPARISPRTWRPIFQPEGLFRTRRGGKSLMTSMRLSDRHTHMVIRAFRSLLALITRCRETMQYFCSNHGESRAVG